MSQPDTEQVFQDRMERVLLTLYGVATGDAFGASLLRSDGRKRIAERQEPEPPWHYSGITVLTREIARSLGKKRRIDRDFLAQIFATAYYNNPTRVYGRVLRKILADINLGHPWQETSRQFFQGQGSMGNGAAARAAPIGAFFADDFTAATKQARLAATVTHAHSEGQAGAMAVAAATAQARRIQKNEDPERGRSVIDAAIAFAPEGSTRQGLLQACSLWRCDDVATVIGRLGNGSRALSRDTVPFALWCAAKHVDDYRSALWCAASGFGDLRSNCAIAGGVMAMAVGRDGLPGMWVHAVEGLPR
jgi:ADP-ribosylglycohydrolase